MEFHFLKETPKADDSGLDFGHGEIVSTLKQIVCKQQQNLTIGLFGGWGAGKSSIVESLKRSLKTAKIPLVLFDVWKHEGDALRRTFLTELVGKLDAEYGKEYFRVDYKTDQRVRFSLSSSKELLSVKWQKLWLHLFILFLFGLVLLGMMLMLDWLFSFIGLSFLGGFDRERVGLMAGAVLSATLLYKYVDYFIKAEKSEYKEDRFQDPHEFEQEFDRIIANLTDKTTKIVVAFDNLDRVSGENALKIIATIKTFLDYSSKDSAHKKNVFFLIPCDVSSMKDHIAFSTSAVDKNDAKELYWDEFLRKFFSTSIWIPEFYPTELERFAVEKLKETKVEEFQNPYLSWLIIRVFHKNPRQIIQFINILLSNFLLLREFCKSGAFHDKEFYRSNVPQLAKFLLIKQRHSACLEEYALRGVYNLSDSAMLEAINDDKFKMLLKQTGDINIPSLEPYFKFRISKMEQEHSAIVQFMVEVATGGENVAQLLDKIDFQNSSAAFANIFRSQLRSINNVLIQSALVSHVLELLRNGKLSPSRALDRDLVLFFSNATDESIFFGIAPKKVMIGLIDRAANITVEERTVIIGKYLATLEVDNTPNKRLEGKLHEQKGLVYEFAVEYHTLLNEPQLRVIRTSLENGFGHNSILELFFKNREIQQVFITQKYIETVFNQFNAFKTIQVALHNLSLMNSFWPRERYTAQIVQSLNSQFAMIFSEEHFQKSPTLLHRFAWAIDTLLQRVLDYNGSHNNDPALISLQASILNFLRVRSIVELLEYLSLLLTMSRFPSSNVSSISLVNAILVEGDEETLVSALGQNPSLLNHFSHEIEEPLLTAITKFVSLQHFVRQLPLADIASIVVKYMELEQMENARTLILRYRDEWEESVKENLLREIVGLFSASNQKFSPSPLFRRFLELIFLVADNDPKMLESSDFWEVIGTMLTENDPMGIQKLAFETIREQGVMMSKADVDAIILKLLAYLRSGTYYDDYLFNDALMFLMERNETASNMDEYMRLVFQLCMFSYTTNVYVVCARAIERLNYNLMNFVGDISFLIDRCGQLEGQRLSDAQIVLKALYERIKPEKAEVFKDIKSRLRQLK